MPHNSAMARNNYKWDGDSRDERPSEFAHSGYSTTTTAALHSTWAHKRGRRKRRNKLARILLSLLIAVGASSLLMYLLVSHLRG